MISTHFHAVRGDLIKILGRLASKKFDAVIIETTGLADPAPVAQTFFVDDFIKVTQKHQGYDEHERSM